MRSATISRKTAETDIELTLNLDGTGESDISSGVGFLDHMLTLFARHGRFDLTLSCVGDTGVDDHHSVEDIGICLGRALNEAPGAARGICRCDHSPPPLEEALILTAVDLSGRSVLCFDLDVPTQKVGSFDTELVEEFFIALSANAGMTLHIRKLAGRNTHHIIEGCFKSFARSLRKAVAIDLACADELPSTKGVLA